ncbi:DUF262 domain-containing protein [Mangrovibacillus cuniculi]|uniref:DUF262 domain-containing protein n=1 Tax=Mangrovibacillus cuniculi TaxID=2593652 RepID=A0A7S8HEN4_9BACI|nr:DUF262 domain-containing protein [Mangrovibacillus cuniculi]QPC45575.1 DUF262 domain-containing protein [Mangrovibacillus cuniculi]
MNTRFKESMKNIKSSRPLISVQDIVTFIDKGEKYLKLSIEEMTEEQEMEILQGIVLSPDYQRNYRSSIKEESSIIESLLIGIPIPEVFLVVSGKNDAQIRHVMDGQHRLNAIYRYINNKFPLKNLEVLGINPQYDNKKFSELDKKDKIKILGSHLSILEFESFEDPEVEIELFKRYNRNTKPLEIQEIEMATYFSETSKYISKFVNVLIEESDKVNEDFFRMEESNLEKLYKIYNITKSRTDKQKNHQEICIIFSVIEIGLQENVRDGVTASKKFLERKSKKYKNNESENLDSLKTEFEQFNNLLLKISEKVEFPFSTGMVSDDKQRLSKFLIGVSIVLAAIYYYFEIELENENLVEDLKNVISYSPIADIEYKASSTNMKNIMNYLFINNEVQNKSYKSLKIKIDKLDEINSFIQRSPHLETPR